MWQGGTADVASDTDAVQQHGDHSIAGWWCLGQALVVHYVLSYLNPKSNP